MHDKAQMEKSISWNRYDLWTIKADTAWRSSDGISNKSQEGKPLTRLETLFGVFSMHAIPHLILSSCEPDCFANCSNAFPATVMRWNFSSESIQSATSLSGSFTSGEPCYQDTGMTVTQHSPQQKWPYCIIYIYNIYIYVCAILT